jgi:hypothetical protein
MNFLRLPPLGGEGWGGESSGYTFCQSLPI